METPARVATLRTLTPSYPDSTSSAATVSSSCPEGLLTNGFCHFSHQPSVSNQPSVLNEPTLTNTFVWYGQAMTPPEPPSRHLSLDVLRGTAILGTLGTNIWIFTNPEGLVGYLSQSTAASTPRAWGVLELVLQQLTQGKFLGLLTLMFGIGLEIQRRSAVRRGRPWPGHYPWRALLLFLDGVLHYLLVVEFDVLMGYAVTGVLVAYLLATSERAQRRWLIGAASCHALALMLVTVLLLVYDSPSTAGVALSPNPYADGTWWELVKFRLDHAALFRLEPVFILALSTAMFLFGAQLVRSGVLDPEGGGLRRRLIRLGAMALVLDMVIGLAGGAAGVVFARYGTAPVVAAGLLAAVVEALEHRPLRPTTPSRPLVWLSAVGRMALSGYACRTFWHPPSATAGGWASRPGCLTASACRAPSPPTWS